MTRLFDNDGNVIDGEYIPRHTAAGGRKTVGGIAEDILTAGMDVNPDYTMKAGGVDVPSDVQTADALARGEIAAGRAVGQGAAMVAHGAEQIVTGLFSVGKWLIVGIVAAAVYEVASHVPHRRERD